MKNLTIRQAKAIAKTTGADGVIILAFDSDGKHAGVSYGSNRVKCRAIGALLDDIFDEIFNGELEVGDGFLDMRG